MRRKKGKKKGNQDIGGDAVSDALAAPGTLAESAPDATVASAVSDALIAPGTLAESTPDASVASAVKDALAAPGTLADSANSLGEDLPEEPAEDKKH